MGTLAPFPSLHSPSFTPPGIVFFFMRSSVFVSFLALSGAAFAATHNGRHSSRQHLHKKRGYKVSKWLEGDDLVDAFN